MWSEILTTTDFTNKSFLAKDISLDLAARLMEGLSKCIQSHCGEGIGYLVYKVKVVYNEIGIESSFPY